jgi:hypothetical protein
MQFNVGFPGKVKLRITGTMKVDHLLARYIFMATNPSELTCTGTG